MSSIQQDYQYYIKHQLELVKKYGGRYIVIKDSEVVGSYDSEIEAYEDAKSKYVLGTFIIKPCLPQNEEPKNILNTRAYF